MSDIGHPWCAGCDLLPDRCVCSHLKHARDLANERDAAIARAERAEALASHNADIAAHHIRREFEESERAQKAEAKIEAMMEAVKTELNCREDRYADSGTVMAEAAYVAMRAVFRAIVKARDA